MRTLGIDLETFSSVDLAKSGVYRYTESKDFEILLFGYNIDGGEIQVVDLASGETIPPEIIFALKNKTVTKWAFNSQFERICLSKWLGMPLGQYLDPRSWRCTMVWSAYMGLPLSLVGAGAVLGLEKQKLAGGKDLIRYFCQPCKPTAANNQRTRNLPIHAPDKWVAFKAYNHRDVEVEMAIQEKLARFPVPESVWTEYHLDQEINDRGVALDMELVYSAIKADERSHAELTRLMRELTGLDNPNSVAQMKRWLSDNGLETDTLGKKTVAKLLKTAPEPLGEVLLLRQQLAKSSVKKYQAMENAVCADGRARGMFQFYGANRTGRFSGRLIQLQNLPQNHMPDLEQTRNLVRNGNYEALTMLYDSVPEVLSELIRTTFVPKTGCGFIVADFSSIERVVLAWLAGEKWVLDAYRAKKDLYIATASQMFHVPVEQIDKKSPLRQKGKVADLACIAEGQLVLTDKGLVPIENVTLQHRLWDGEEWVSHKGVISKGLREVMEYEGLCATPEHLVWIEGKQKPVPFEFAAASRAHLVQTGNGRKAVRLGNRDKFGKALEQSDESLLCPYQMLRMRKCSVAEPIQSEQREIKRMSELFSDKTDSTLAGQAAYSGKTTLRQSKRPQISQLWRTWYSMEVSDNLGSRFMDTEKLPRIISQSGYRSYRQQQRLRTWQYTACYTHGQPEQQTDSCIDSLGAKVLAICTQCCHKKIIRRLKSQRSITGRGNGSIRETEELARNRSAVRVYDIRNAGPYHRFTVSGKLVHNCGYGGSVGALKAMGALEMGLTEEELQPLVFAWRNANTKIVRLWWEVDRVVKTAVKERTMTETHGIRFEYRSGILFIQLPSGRKLAYVKPKIEINSFGSESVTYEGVGATKKWERLESYGPKFVENIIQSISRDLLCYAMQALRGYSIVMHVHDEIVIEADKQMSLEALCEQMSKVPPWAKGLLLRADGFVCRYYKKD